ncbi:Dibenzothiophene desulfurization enzyme C [Corynebacterium provencense]|uniref:Dibenzothiophene monooxygenase n=1 Tax=Corynebacterium provencense TaxID=1737425 RepID=A0A2Z3YNM1_9CORY|nr:acyl-CoA dehydrogenase family protein [Corynebacterium provencense]AWT25409.1 Dibenzothiophene desulfurization enzyme C [Corynebacterium provencense]
MTVRTAPDPRHHPSGTTGTNGTADPVDGARSVAEVVDAAGPGADRAEAVAGAVKALKTSGLLAATVPRRLGGPGAPPSRIAEALRVLASADGSLAQIPQSHFTFSRWLFDGEHPESEQYWADRLISGTLVANAQAERDPVTVGDTVDGVKVFCTGSPYADVLAVTGRPAAETAPADGQTVAVFVEADAPGVTVHHDWDALGQRYTGSGTVSFHRVPVPSGRAYTFGRALALPGYGAFAQLLHAAIDVGVAGAALDAALALVTDSRTGPGARPVHRQPGALQSPSAGQEDADPDDLTAHLAGELVARRFAAEAVVEKAGRSLDALWAADDPSPDLRTRVALQTAAAKVTTGELTVDLASRVYELTGTRGAAVHGDNGLDRYWRDLRTHTLHERRRDKLAVLGREALTGRSPVLGPQL